MIVEGQVHGGIGQGVGQALLEGVHYNKDGQLVTASFNDYCMPRADDLPSYDVGMTQTPCPSNPLGIEGLRRGRRHCRAARGHQRDYRCRGTRERRHAGYPARRLARGADRRHKEGRRIIQALERHTSRKIDAEFSYHRVDSARKAANLAEKNRTRSSSPAA